MSGKLWVTALILVVALAVIIGLAYIAMAQNTVALSIVALIFTVAVIVGFDYLVIKPALLSYAKRDARQMCDAGQIVDPKLHKKLCARLDTAPKDAEAAGLRKKLEGLPKK